MALMSRPGTLPGLKVVQSNMERTSRRYRNPIHTFQIHSRPFEITPFFIAPVLPGETMKKLSFRSLVKSDPIKNELIGWWKEYYFFYVKHSDLPDREDFYQMHLDPSFDMSAAGHLRTTDNDWFCGFNGAASWVTYCLIEVVEQYFRNDGELWNDYVGDTNHPVASIRKNGVLDSAVDDDAFAAAYDETVVNEAGTGTVTAGDIDRALARYEFLRQNGLTEAATYEDYLRTFGVQAQRETLHKPELIRYTSDWALPSSAVDGSGNVSTRMIWNIQGSADKDRFISEPGFLFGVTVARPKVYYENTVGAAVGLMQDSYSWLPAVLKDTPETSLILQTNSLTAGYLQNQTSDYWLDIRDLLLYGDEYVNFAKSATDAHLCPLPNDGLTNKDYPTSAFIDELFEAADPANEVDEDGIVSLSILGTQMDYT